jgi:aryl-alcohol dehydrogenase-like predicted oxidoreductase
MHGSIALGAMLFGTRVDGPTSHAILDRFVDRGGRWVDTADCYAFWLSESGRGDDSERVIGEWLRARPGSRERVLLSTKIGSEPVGDDSWRGWPENREGLGRRAVRDATRGSLTRLGVDFVDLLWLHQEDRRVPLDETVDALGEVAAAGEARRFGASNHPAWRVEAARARSRETGAPPLDAVQLAYTYLRPRPGATPDGNDHPFGQASAEQLDHAHAEGLEVWAYSPLLRGAYDRADREPDPVFRHDGTARRLSVLREVAHETGLTPGQVVLAWLAGGDHPVIPIVGASAPEHVDSAFDAIEHGLPSELRARMDAVAP